MIVIRINEGTVAISESLTPDQCRSISVPRVFGDPFAGGEVVALRHSSSLIHARTSHNDDPTLTFTRTWRLYTVLDRTEQIIDRVSAALNVSPDTGAAAVKWAVRATLDVIDELDNASDNDEVTDDE
ncbi:MAG: hypothetical protein GY679_05460 [Mycoplasma sp.]|nr:hypothetical protein [Mycoplasma sp.]